MEPGGLPSPRSRRLCAGPIPEGCGPQLADAFETLIGRPGCKVTVTDGGRTDGEVTIEASEPVALAAFVLQRLRQNSGKSLAEVAHAMGRSARSGYHPVSLVNIIVRTATRPRAPWSQRGRRAVLRLCQPA